MITRTGLLSVLAIAACGDNARPSDCDAWRQWASTASHEGASCVRGQPLQAMLGDMVYDPFLAQEVADRGDLFVHYQTPLLDGDDLYMMTKHGTYTPCNFDSTGVSCFDPDELYRLSSQVWSEQHFTIGQDGSLALQWSFDSDWKPEPGLQFEPMFQPALAGAVIAIPGAGGALWELGATSGSVVRHVQPFGNAIDPDTYVAGGLAVARDGTIYYNAITLDHGDPLGGTSRGWLVVVAPDGTTAIVDYETLVPGAPGPADPCFGSYDVATAPLPWPPVNPDGTLVTPPSSPCGAQRPGVNTTPAIAEDGTIFVVSRAHLNASYSYVVALDRSLAPRWATSLRDFLHDGCGVTSSKDPNDTNFCRPGTPIGVERITGLLPAGHVDDNSSSSPVALPDGGVLYGALTGYNDDRGHLFKLDGSGAISGSYDFGWDSTPAVVDGPLGYHIVIKDNHYGKGPFYITELDPLMDPIWQFQSTNTRSCARQPDGTISCTDDHPAGFEWCVNAPAVDRDGTVYVTSEDGYAYAIAPDGKLRDSMFLDQALGAAYTPIALDHNGRVFTLNNGRLAVLGNK